MSGEPVPFDVPVPTSTAPRPQTWDEWRERSLSAYVHHQPGQAKVRPQLVKMHTRHGATPGQDCTSCRFLLRKEGDFEGHYLKCAHYGNSSGPGTDWRRSWPACGLWLERDAGEGGPT